jgi:reactive intermediate/imine deaminase
LPARAGPRGAVLSIKIFPSNVFPSIFQIKAMSKQIISTTQAPAAIGTYSQATRVGNTIWVSGQIPMDPATKELVNGDMEAQVRRVFENLKAIVIASGAGMDDVVKVSVFLIDLAHFALVNKVMAEYFREPYPARAAIGVASLPRGAQVEAECIVAL